MNLITLSFIIACFILYINQTSQRGWVLQFISQFFRKKRIDSSRGLIRMRIEMTNFINDSIIFPTNVKVSSVRDLSPEVRQGMWEMQMSRGTSLRKEWDRRNMEMTDFIKRRKIWAKLENPTYRCPICMVPWYTLLIFPIFSLMGLHELEAWSIVPTGLAVGGFIMIYNLFLPNE